MSTTNFIVTGLTCNHCVATVSRSVAMVPGVSGVTIDLVANGESTLHVDSAETVDADSIARAVTDSGYELVR